MIKNLFKNASILSITVVLLGMLFACPTPTPTPDPGWFNTDKMVFDQFFGQSIFGADYPAGICQDAAGNIYVACYRSLNAVHRFKSDLTYDKSYVGFDRPFDVAIDSQGRLVVLDAGNQLVKYINVDDGSVISSFSISGVSTILTYGFSLDNNDNVYIGCYYDNKMVKFAPNGTLLMTIDSISGPLDVAVNQGGAIFVLSYNTSCVYKYDATGTAIGQFGSAGAGDGEFSNPTGIALDKYGKVYIADGHNCRLQKLEADGTFICKIDQDSSGNPIFRRAWGITVNQDGFIYATDIDGINALKIHQEDE